MKAIEFAGAGDAGVIRLCDAEMPVIRPTDLIIRVHAAGVNRADILQRQGIYGEKPDFGDSLTPGLEIAGDVVEVGPGTSGFNLGDRVMAVVGGGAYAEFARANFRMCMPIPDELTYIQGAAVPEVFVTAYEALGHLGDVQPGSWVLIHAAAGGVGSAAVQLAAAIGARTVFTVGNQESIEKVLALGGTVGVNYKEEDFVQTVIDKTSQRGVDVVVDFIGGPYLERNIRSLADGGRLVQVGCLGGAQGPLDLGQVVHRYLRIVGTVMKSRSLDAKAAMISRFRERWLNSYAGGPLKPIVDSVFPLSRTADAHRHMEDSQHFGKIVLSID